jgi:signal peptidase I
MQEAKKQKKLSPELRRKIIILAAKICAVLLFLYIVFFRLYGLTRITTNVMSPRVSGGDLAIVFHAESNFTNGDVLIYEKDGNQYIGRVAAQQGDVIDVKEGKIYINGYLEDTSYYGDNIFPESSNISYPYTVAEKQIFILGDNRNEVDDSRSFGAINYSEIRGRIIGILRTNAL